jgi:serine/threonine-protein kinase HipA
MTSERPREAYAWVWLPGAAEPVVAGRLDEAGGAISFVYGRSYLAREEAIPLYLPELPLRRGTIRPLAGLDAPGCLLDARPDAWGQRVIMNRLLGAQAAETDPGDLGVITYLLASDSDRVGALDFQVSAEHYVPRGGQSATLDELARAAELVQAGVPLTPALAAALMSGTAVGGARPKALMRAGERRLIAKFSSTTDVVPLVQGEYVAMELGRRAGLDVAAVELTTALGKHVLLVERFDREPGSARRRAIVSALTLLELRELQAPWASYAELAQTIRARFSEPTRTLRELFARITFNVVVGNTDDHARNHAAFWDGQTLALTPAYDVCPYPRGGGEASQAMIIGDDSDSFRLSQLSGCVRRAHLYGLTEEDARAIIDHQLDVVRSQWDEVCDLAQLSAVDRGLLWGRAVMHPFALEGYRG